MSEEKKTVKRLNRVQIVGTLAETGNLKFDADMENKSNSKIRGAIVRADYKKPAFVIDVNGQKIGVNAMITYKDKVDKESGKIVPNDRFKALQTVMEYEVGTRVKIDAQIQVGMPYAGKNGVVEAVDVVAFTISSTSVPEEDCAEGKVSGIIKNITEETANDDETGRLLVDFWIMNYDGTVSPFPLVVEEDIADGFSNTYDNGDSAILDYDITSKQVGGKKAESADFGRKASKIVGGYSKTEYSVFNGENALDEESEYYIDPDDFKKLLKEHKQKCEEALNAKKDEEKPKKGLGSSRKSKIEDDDDDDANPFDD